MEKKLKKLTLIVTDNGNGGLLSDFESIGFNEVEVIGAIERAKIAILKNFLDDSDVETKETEQ